MPNSEYDDRVDHLVRSWREDIYEGVLMDDVLPAVKIHAYASLQQMRDVYDDVPTIFPTSFEHTELYDHYGHALFTRLSMGSGSILNALKSIQFHMDCHAAVAICRRAHEALWQMFWLCNPTIDADERIRRLLKLTLHEIKEALRVFSGGVNPDIASKLRHYQSNIKRLVGKYRYSPEHGRSEYQDYFGLMSGEAHVGVPSHLREIDAASFSWKMMSNMTHANVVYDWIGLMQADFRSSMDRIQLGTVSEAMRAVVNLSTLVMVEAKMPDEQIERVNVVMRHQVDVAESLIELRRSCQPEGMGRALPCRGLPSPST